MEIIFCLENLMEQHLGLTFAFLALIFWGVGDFMIQKSVRANSVMRTLFYICISGGVALFPFVKDEFLAMMWDGQMHLLMMATSLVILVAAILEFVAMKRGKLSVIEPILSFELPVAVILSILLRSESLSVLQIFMIIFALVGFILAMQHNRHLFNFKNLKFEDGIFLALGGAAIMGVVNFMVGVASQETSALLTIWYINIVLTVICAFHISLKKEWGCVSHDLKTDLKDISLTCLFDNCAWIAYAYATTYIPISIATTISDSYIALTVLLGIFVNHEQVRKHQVAGIAITVFSIFALSVSMG